MLNILRSSRIFLGIVCIDLLFGVTIFAISGLGVFLASIRFLYSPIINFQTPAKGAEVYVPTDVGMYYGT